MSDHIMRATIGSLFYGIGELIARAGLDPSTMNRLRTCALLQDTEISECFWHPRGEPMKSRAGPHSPLPIIMAIERFTCAHPVAHASHAGANALRPLRSIFCSLGAESACVQPHAFTGQLMIPSPDAKVTLGDLASLATRFIDLIQEIPLAPESIVRILEAMESCFSTIPYDMQHDSASDISIYDHARAISAFTSCVFRILEESGAGNCSDWAREPADSMGKLDLFCVASVDLSGIQSFIYDIPDKGALKSLRARSFYLELLMENTVDELLNAADVNRANVLYAGGGHAYLLFPNIPSIKAGIRQSIHSINCALRDVFGTRLYFAVGLREASAHVLMGKGGPEAYAEIFQGISSQISRMKLRRWRAADIRDLNHAHRGASRECSVCGDSAVADQGEDCRTCSAFTAVSQALLSDDVWFVLFSEKPDVPWLPLFDCSGKAQYFCPLFTDDLKRFFRAPRADIIRVYGKNGVWQGPHASIALYMGSYAARSSDGGIMSMDEMTDSPTGIRRSAMLRADVDSLGKVFVEGFSNKPCALIRASAFSRTLNAFFTRTLNNILDCPSSWMEGQSSEKKLVVIYAGGDDVCFVGAWHDIICAALDIQRAFSMFTGGALTLSAGIAVCGAHHPISAMARLAGELEDAAKRNQREGKLKDSAALFGFEPAGESIVCRHRYGWSDLRGDVLGAKLTAITQVMSVQDDLGHAFLYRLLQLLRSSEGDKLNIARLAYLLARREPGKDANDSQRQRYDAFSRNIYAWAASAKDRKQLITAIMMYAYAQRKREERSQ